MQVPVKNMLLWIGSLAARVLCRQRRVKGRATATQMSALWWSSVASAVWFATGCGVLAVEEPTATGMCAQDSDCPANLRCYAQRICVVRDVAAFVVQARLTPGNDSGKIVEQFDLKVAAQTQTEVVALMLGEPALVRGTVKRAGAATLAASIPGSLVATAKSKSGAPLRFQVASFATLQTFAGSPTKQGFELQVQPGYTYEVVFRPEASDQIPPYISTITVGGSIDNWKIELPGEDQLLQVRGRMVAGSTPVTGLRVFLVDEDGRLDSTRAVVDAKGEFALLVDPAAKQGRLRFEPAEPGAPLPQGEMVKWIDVHKVALKGETLDLGELDLGAIAPAVAVTLTALNADGKPEGAALVRVQRSLNPATPAVKAWIESHGYTDNLGVWTGLLPPGPATVTVIPEVHSTAARWVAKLKVAGEPLQVALGRRQTVSGQVLDYRKAPVALAVVRMRRVTTTIGTVMSGSASLGEAEIQGQTDAQGRFSLPADQGGWWLWVIPRLQDGLPQLLAAELHIQPDSQPTPLAIAVPAPVLLVGRAVTAKGIGVAGVSVDVLTDAVQQPLLGASGGSLPGRTLPGAELTSVQHRLLGRAMTDASGQFEVLLAPPIQASAAP